MKSLSFLAELHLQVKGQRLFLPQLFGIFFFFL